MFGIAAWTDDWTLASINGASKLESIFNTDGHNEHCDPVADLFSLVSIKSLVNRKTLSRPFACEVDFLEFFHAISPPTPSPC